MKQFVVLLASCVSPQALVEAKGWPWPKSSYELVRVPQETSSSQTGSYESATAISPEVVCIFLSLVFVLLCCLALFLIVKYYPTYVTDVGRCDKAVLVNMGPVLANRQYPVLW